MMSKLMMWRRMNQAEKVDAAGRRSLIDKGNSIRGGQE
jgi:hypothetical protein